MLMRKKHQNNYEMKERERDVCVIGQCKYVIISYWVAWLKRTFYIIFIYIYEYILRIRKNIYIYILYEAPYKNIYAVRIKV